MKRLIYIIGCVFIVQHFLSISIVTAKKNEIEWTSDELLFMEKHPVIRLAIDPLFVPYEFIDDDGQYKGIVHDYLTYISKQTDLQFDIRTDLSWPEAYHLATEGELDAMPAVGKTEDRQEHFLFSKPYYEFKRVIATQTTEGMISSLEDLEGLTVAVQRNSSHHGFLLNYPKINISLYDSVEAAIVAVAYGDEAAFLGNLATTNYIIRKNGLTDLRYVAFEADKTYPLHFAARKDWPELITIFDKTIEGIPEQKKKEIQDRWIQFEPEIDLKPFIRIVSIIGGIALIILLVSFFWITRLRKEIEQRKKAEKSLLKANKTLEKMSMLDGLTNIYNRRYFDNFLNNLWHIQTTQYFPMSIVLLDIDHFKKYNDTYGHLAGDQCLKTVAKIIEQSAEGPSHFTARYGGEEFVVLLSNINEKEAAHIAEKIRKNIEDAIIFNGNENTKVTISIGVASLIETDKTTKEEIIEAADQALYAAKDRGRNRVVCASDLKQ